MEIYHLINSINSKRGGLTRNLFTRARLLAEKLDQTMHVVSFDFNPNYDQVRKDLLQFKISSERIVIHNLFEFLSHQEKSSDESSVIPQLVEEEGLVPVKDEEKNGVHLFRNGVYVKYKEYDDENRLKFIDTFNENRYRIRREYVDAQGRVRRVVSIDHLLDKPRQARFFDENGRCFLSNWYEPETGKCTRVHWFDLDGQLIRTFDNEKEMKLYWLHQLVQSESQMIFQADDHKSGNLLLSFEHPQVATIRMLHSHHLSEPYTYGAPISSIQQKSLDQVDRVDAYVTVTEQQKQDIQRQFGMRTTFHSVPHAAPRIQLDPDIQRDPWTAVMVGRFVKSKQCDHAIRAFKKVSEQFPEAKLELWGYGREEQNLRELIEELGLEDQVSIQGPTQDALSVFQRAAFSLLPTEREAFGLVIAESLAAGAPVIAYDVTYGPRDMITHGVNGFLIPRDDIEAMSDAMITLFQDRNKWETMCREAPKISEKFSEEKFVQRWLEVYEQAMRQRRKRVRMKKPDCQMASFTWTDPDTGAFKLEGEVIFNQDTESWRDDVQIALYLRKRTELVDRYFPAIIEWTGDHRINFESELTLAEWIKDQKALRGRWDVYVSITARNAHHFVRLAGQTIPGSIEVNQSVIQPYYTEYGNLSLHSKKTAMKPEKKGLMSLLVGK